MSIESRLKEVIPAGMKDHLRPARDVKERIWNTRTPPERHKLRISPLWLDFDDTGRDQVDFFIEVMGLESTDSVLDVGCGIGRVAIPLTTYLTASTRYEGFDLDTELIDWCTEHISNRHPNFGFTRSDVSASNLPGAVTAAEYVYPYDDASFDLVYLGSVLTQLLPDGAEQYLAEAARVAKPGAGTSMTWLLYPDDPPPGRMHRSFDSIFPHDFGHYRLRMLELPEERVAYSESWVRDLYRRHGLRIVEPLRTDVTYTYTRAPDAETGAHLHYCYNIVAVRE